jgi:hypothetical protein
VGVYRTRAPRQGMTFTDWKIALGMALPSTALIGVAILVKVFG